MHDGYFKTLFLTGLHGQYFVLRDEFAPYILSSDKVVQFGNVLSMDPLMKAYEKGADSINLSTARYVYNVAMKHDNWTSLIGPNDMMVLNFPGDWGGKEAESIIRSSWFSESEKFMYAAHSDKGRFVSQGGLTYGKWVEIGRPDTAEEAAARINETHDKKLYHGPCYKLGDSPNFSASPIWADPILETYPSWVTAQDYCPFDQVHGADSMSSQRGRKSIQSMFSPLKTMDKIGYTTYGSRVVIKDTAFVAVNIDFPSGVVYQVPSPQRMYLEKVSLSKVADTKMLV